MNGIDRQWTGWPKPTVILLVSLFWMAGGLRAEWRLDSSRAVQGTGLVYVQKKITKDGESYPHPLDLVLIDTKQCTLRVVDNLEGKRALDSAMEQGGCLAGVNGGYFHPDFTPLGLVVSKGREIHPLGQGKLMSGLVVVRKNRISLLRIAEFKPAPTVIEALQSGPFLIDQGKPVPGLNATKRADRTVILTDGKGGCALLMAGSVTLAETAQILNTPGMISGMEITRALNLDGGSSSGLWIRNPPVYRPEFKRVRNFLGVVARE